MISVSGVAIAALGGAAVGLERQRTGHATGPDARFGGIRTFTMLGGLGGIAGGFIVSGWLPVAAVMLAASAALVAIGYAAKSRDDVDATTEVAAVVVLASGTLAGVGQTALASGIIAATAVLLLEKSRLHAMAEKVDDVTLRASARFAALALVILPLLPAGSYGPFGAVQPRQLWALVLFFSGLSFLGWIARRLLGPTHGVVVAGLLGGIISSTSVTLSFARASRRSGSGLALALGTVGAGTVMLVRVTLASSILNRSVARAFVPYVWIGLVIGILILVVTLRWRHGEEGGQPVPAGSPLQLGAALQMTALFQVVLIVVSAVTAWWSVRALMVTSAMIGLTDLDALTLSLARNSAGLTPDVAGRALAIGVLSNTVLKLAVVLVIGRGAYRPVAGLSLAAVAASVAAMLFL
jgi:uncharacterized membrane protein (DUF4010 family)